MQQQRLNDITTLHGHTKLGKQTAYKRNIYYLHSLIMQLFNKFAINLNDKYKETNRV